MHLLRYFLLLFSITVEAPILTLISKDFVVTTSIAKLFILCSLDAERAKSFPLPLHPIVGLAFAVDVGGGGRFRIVA